MKSTNGEHPQEVFYKKMEITLSYKSSTIRDFNRGSYERTGRRVRPAESTRP